MELEVAIEGHKYPRRMKTEPPLYLTRKQNMWFEMRLQSSILYPGVAAIPGHTAEKENRTYNQDGQDSGTQVILSIASERPELLTQDPVSG